MSGEAVGLLVSVRSVQEARAASEGGCAVLDVKEPAHGPLGMADPAVIGEAVECGRAAGVATSMALGEVVDWTDEGAGRRPETSRRVACVYSTSRPQAGPGKLIN